MKLNYKHTTLACYNAYITQAITNNLPPLLFVTFEKSLGISTVLIGLLITINFGAQLAVDLLSAKYVDKIGYRNCFVIAHLMSAVGLVCMGVLPFVLPNAFLGLIVSYIINSVGSGMIEVILSPTVEAIPGGNKASRMSMLHSFYCFGHLAVVLLSTLYFTAIGIENWRILPAIWAIVPVINMIAFAVLPLPQTAEEGMSMDTRELLSLKIFWVFFALMICSGAAEQAMAQWASMFAEQGLNVSKTVGDLMGPCMFALLMGISRAFYGKFGSRINLKGFISGSCILCIISYLITVFAPYPIISLAGCALCGLSVGIMWPGTFSLAAKRYPCGGTAMFALLAFAGDLGCIAGPNTVSLFSGGNLKNGMLCAAVFPILMLILVKAGLKRKKA